MDAVSESLAEVRARTAIFRQTIMRPPWALRMASGAPLTLATMLRGHAWIVSDQQAPVLIEAGDIAVIRGDVPYTVADDPATTPSLVVTSADYCSATEGVERASRPARTCGTPVGEAAVLLSGAFERRGELSERLLRALPAVLVVPAGDSPALSMEMVAEEIARDRPGQQMVLDRLLDLMLVSALRSWFADPDADAPAWCRALDDPVVGAALRLLHDAPAYPWTVADLAAKVGVSRAALARRFTALVGEPPMAYLASWRITLAADLLQETDHMVGTIARKVGYANAFALSAAFKRLRGTRPSDHRNPVPGRRAG
ncbi:MULTISPECIES: AraC family transcriptional regulator [unclassified Pseudofrankia]|uniref:AraC family transcriptional regulator n=1 Tax=unclassified Pseudofrankia TaxID=2994372 RepID=UPI0008DA06CA|nr:MULTISPECIES: AraC family transcriptional regulator [unclassified Pseudofrankia]MDT3441032.1 AraC family transcriptional regulator [Pseudofrankia sp. BMG5.37]OHV42543.1 AraC family transcriptional regulator [Pseudofrankia sp. BMG5.36]